MEVDVGVDKLVFSGKNYDFTDDNLFTIKVYNEENNEVLLKKEKFHIFFDKKNKSYTFPIYPWITETGKYKIVIERDYENILELFNSPLSFTGKKYITADIARFGSDKAVIMVWDGWDIIEIFTFDISKTMYTSGSNKACWTDDHSEKQ
jgi:hypothetical protein